jgi:hypothetical protein
MAETGVLCPGARVELIEGDQASPQAFPDATASVGELLAP